jgi:hypothetical protein
VEKEIHTYHLKAEITIFGPAALRLDVRTTLDLPVASIVLTDKKIQYALYRNHAFYSGVPSPHALDPVFPLTVNAATLVQVLKEQRVTGAQCELDGDKNLSSCQGKAGDTTFMVKWSKRQSSGPLAGRATKILLELPQSKISLRFYVNDLHRDVSNAERSQTIEVPADFRRLSVPTE